MKKLVMVLLSALLAVSPAMAEENIEEQVTEIETEYQEELTTEASEIVTEAVTEEIVTAEPTTEEIITEPEPVTAEPTTEEVIIEEPATVIPEPTTEEYLIDAWSGTEQITDLKGTSSPEGSVLTWSPIPDAEGYLIGAIQNGNAYKQIGYVVGGNTTTYTDKDASMEKYSYYWVFPYKRVNGKIARGAVSSRYVYGIKLLAAPQNFKAESVPGGVNLTWTEVPNVYKYLIKCRRGNGTVTVLDNAYNGTYFDEAAPSDVTSYYWVFATQNGYPNDLIGASSTYAYGKAIVSGTGFREIGKYLKSYQHSDSTRYYIVLHNDNGGNANIKVNAIAYDSTGNIIGAGNSSWPASEPGYNLIADGLFEGIRAEQISRLEYTVTSSKPNLHPAQSKIKESHSIIGNKVIITFTNTSDLAIEGAYANVLFLRGGSVVGEDFISMANSGGTFAPNSTITEEASVFEETFDNVILIYSGYTF